MMELKHLEERFGLTIAEEDFLKHSKTVQKDDINQSRVISEMYLSKTIDTVVYNIIESNKELSKSNERHSKWMKWLTIALATVAFVQLGVKIYEVIAN